LLGLLTLGLAAFGLVFLYSTTGLQSQEKMGDALYFVKRQGFAVGLGALAMFLASRLSSRSLQRIAPVLLPAAIVLLILPLVPGLGDSAGGAQRWINLGGVRFQPGEFSKLLCVVFMASFLARHESRLSEFISGLVKPALLILPVAVLYLLQPDFGSTVVVVACTLCMAAATGMRIRYLVIGCALIALGFALLIVVSPYRMHRIMSFLSPWEDASGKGYQLIQSLIALGTGQFTGVGLGASQQKLFFLPAAHTDFIFAVIAEELGFLGCVGVVAAYVVLLWRGLRIAKRVADNTFAFALAVGLTALIVVPALLNMGVVTGLLPTKGMVLPLLGYGGSSIITSMIAVGLLLGIARQPASH